MKIETIRGTLPLQTNVTSVLRGGFYLVIGLFRLNMVSVCKIQIEWGQQGKENIDTSLLKIYLNLADIFGNIKNSKHSSSAFWALV